MNTWIHADVYTYLTYTHDNNIMTIYCKRIYSDGRHISFYLQCCSWPQPGYREESWRRMNSDSTTASTRGGTEKKILFDVPTQMMHVARPYIYLLYPSFYLKKLWRRNKTFQLHSELGKLRTSRARPTLSMYTGLMLAGTRTWSMGFRQKKKKPWICIIILDSLGPDGANLSSIHAVQMLKRTIYSLSMNFYAGTLLFQKDGTNMYICIYDCVCF